MVMVVLANPNQKQFYIHFHDGYLTSAAEFDHVTENPMQTGGVCLCTLMKRCVAFITLPKMYQTTGSPNTGLGGTGTGLARLSLSELLTWRQQTEAGAVRFHCDVDKPVC